MHELLDFHSDVSEARQAGRPLVALETTAIAHGLPWPRNLETAQAMEQAVCEAGAIPATIAILDGRVKIGLTPAELERIATAEEIAKVSRRDFAPVLASGGLGATTVAGTLIAAARAGISIFGTGGIGGVHQGGQETLDISSDLIELGRQPVAVVASGAKSILDLPRTLEFLETQGVPVIGYGSDDFPAFYKRRSGLEVLARADGPEAAARMMQAHWALGLDSGLLIANPIPAAAALDGGNLDNWTAEALAEATAQGVTGKEVTPFVLQRLFDLSGGATLEANIALLIANAGVAGEIAVAYRGLGEG